MFRDCHSRQSKELMRFGTMNVQTVAGWVGRVLRFDFSAFDEIRDERTATAPAVLIVLGGSFIAGLGVVLWAFQHDDLPEISAGEVFIKAALLGSLMQATVWFGWVYLVHLMLTRGYGHVVAFSDLVRPMGLAFSPIIFSILVGLSVLAVPFGLASFVLVFLFTNIAIQQTTGADLREATMANITGFLAFVVFMGMFANVAEVGTGGGVGGVAPGILFFSLDF